MVSNVSTLETTSFNGSDVLITMTDSVASNTSILNVDFDSNSYDNMFLNENLREFSTWYGGVHGYLSLIVCFFGIPTNLINITVLTRKHMQTSINLVLTWMAVSDMLTMIDYVPFAIHFYCDYPSNSISADKNSIGWMRYLLFHGNFSATTHTISIWLGVSLAIFRYKHIQSPETGNMVQLQRLIRSRIVIFGITAGSVLLLIPNYMSTKLEIYRKRNTSMYIIEDLKLGTDNVKPVVFLNLILYSSVAKIIPCLLMIIYGGLLLRTIDVQVREKRRKLSKMGVIIQRPLHTTRTTAMLLIVIVLFLLTELPQGVLIIVSLFMKGFFDNVYIPLGDLMDILALVNNGINFILYCSMNREFRRTLVRLMCIWSTERRPTMNGNSVKGSTTIKGSVTVDHRNPLQNGLSTDEMQTFVLSSEQNANASSNQEIPILNEGTQTNLP